MPHRHPHPDPQLNGELESLILGARQGGQDALGQLLESCRQYLTLVAHFELDREIQSKVGASDVVQETFVEASRDFAQFQGQSSSELWSWLTTILRNNLSNLVRSYRHTKMRDVGMEVPLNSRDLQEDPDSALSTREPTASQCAMNEELAKSIEDALARLANDHRNVIILRNREQLSFEQIAELMGRSTEAARKLWGRAIEHLQQELEPSHERR